MTTGAHASSDDGTHTHGKQAGDRSADAPGGAPTASPLVSRGDAQGRQGAWQVRDKDAALLVPEACPARPLAALQDGPGRWLVTARPASGAGAGEAGCEWTVSVQSQVPVAAAPRAPTPLPSTRRHGGARRGRAQTRPQGARVRACSAGLAGRAGGARAGPGPFWVTRRSAAAAH